jgi:chromosomal replication initiator protein
LTRARDRSGNPGANRGAVCEELERIARSGRGGPVRSFAAGCALILLESLMMAKWDYRIFWEETMNQFRQDVGDEEFTIWLSNLGYLDSTETEISVSVPSLFFQEQFKPRYHFRIEEKLRELTGKNLSILLQVVPRNKTAASGQPAAGQKDGAKQRQETRESKTQGTKKKQHIQLREDYTFDKYVIGENNSFAANAAIAISKNPGKAYNPFLIYGGVGLGKTHLMQAIGNYINESFNDKIIYTTAENFLNEYVQAISESKMTNENKMNVFKNKFRYTDVLLIDDIHFFQDKPGVQEELFHTFNTLLDAKKQLVFTCDRPVSELKKISERLMSRFEQCLKVDLQPPKYETRYAILKSTVESQQADVPTEVIDLISKNISSNVRDLLSALNTLIAYQKLMGKPLTLENSQQQLKNDFASPKQSNMSVENIIKVVADEYNLSSNDLKGKKRNKKIVTARHIAMYLAREMTEYSTTEIGREFNRDHSTVISAYEKLEALIQTDTNFYFILEKLKRSIKEYSVKS